MYVHVCKRETLREAYRLTKANDGAPGVDVVTFEAIEAGGFESFLEQLREELWQRTGHDYSIHSQSWTQWDANLARDEEITLVIQVNGKLRDRITVPASTTEAEAKQIAAESTRVKPHLEGKKVIKEIYVPGRLVNLVVK